MLSQNLGAEFHFFGTLIYSFKNRLLVFLDSRFHKELILFGRVENLGSKLYYFQAYLMLNFNLDEISSQLLVRSHEISKMRRD